ncbi:hypothetical protein C2E31_28585 [Rhodopirellula baltica]|nr:hypothetical protein C2E31_28585 [Rhodopirellula baltica]
MGPFAHAAADEPTDQFRMAVRVEAIDPARVRSAVASTMTAVEDCFVLWEVDATNCSTITLAIAQIAVSHHDVMQFVAIDRQKRFWSTNEIAVIAELGVACILNRPEDLAVAARLVWRHGS